MQTISNFIFSLELALLLTHEMDAIRGKEWEMFIILKDMDDERAYSIFMLMHIPLYTIILALLFSNHIRIGLYIVDVFLIAHTLVHIGFRKHPANKLNNTISKYIIQIAGVLSIIHLLLI